MHSSAVDCYRVGVSSASLSSASGASGLSGFTAGRPVSVSYRVGLQASRAHSRTLPACRTLPCMPKGLLCFWPTDFFGRTGEPACCQEVFRRVSSNKLRHRSGPAREFEFGFRRRTMCSIDIASYRRLVGIVRRNELLFVDESATKLCGLGPTNSLDGKAGLIHLSHRLHSSA